VLIGGKKVCGILSEATWIGNDLAAVIVGIGINVHTDFSGTPLAEIATSIETEAGREVDRLAVLASLLDHFDHWVLDPALRERWESWLGTLGRRVRVYTDPHKESSPFYVGLAERVDEDGALYVRLDSGEVRRVIAADVGLAEA